MATGYSPSVVTELWMELTYMVDWITNGQEQRVDIYWALEIIWIVDSNLNVLDSSNGFS